MCPSRSSFEKAFDRPFDFVEPNSGGGGLDSDIVPGLIYFTRDWGTNDLEFDASRFAFEEVDERKSYLKLSEGLSDLNSIRGDIDIRSSGE